MLRKMFGIEMEVPTGKLPGFYAQAIHKIGDEVTVYDRDQQLFIVENEAERDKLARVLTAFRMHGEAFTLWLLPPDIHVRLLSDYGFSSISDQHYLYDHLILRFRFRENAGTAEDRNAAIAQIKQHILAVVEEGTNQTYIIDANHKQLLDKVAAVFHTSLEWLND